ncbi:DUF3823 domain-containing protein [Paraflavitalea pollutisoli]|uniref:DUF3823 domain-containing protein n=1 Tax=Paraflavitalea pollutisoli TaxID=3034143 RepID=UPI0023EC248D|nr:DUF3823 domain-containing protein [Paraflavitalea sp. H1-2-19X]
MKTTSIIYTALAVALLFTACTKDNYKAPGSVLSGRIVYQGQTLQVRTPTVNGSGSTTTGGVQLELWQRGYQLFTKIPVYVNQDGTFSATLFDGDYKLVRLGGAPWQNNTDSIDVQVRGSQSIDVPVVPYFTVNAPAFTFNKADTTVTGTFTPTQVTAGRTLENAAICVGATQFTDVINNIVQRSEGATPGAAKTITITVNPNRYNGSGQENIRKRLAEMLNKQYGFLRIGVKTNGVGESIYTTVVKVDMKF